MFTQKNNKEIIMNMKRFLLCLISTIIMSSLLSCNEEKPDTPYESPIPTFWEKIDWQDDYPDFTYKGLAPSCANCPREGCAPRFSFFAKGGTTNNLVIFFDGGGACWHSSNCLYGLTYATSVNETVEDLQNNMSGLADFADPNNPFSTWNAVFIPYCTGDVHVGANDYDYPNDLYFLFPDITSGEIRHRGKVNFRVVLKWVQDTFKTVEPEKIFVAGSSAGAYGALINFPDIKDAYPASTTYCMPDAGNGVIPEDPAIFRGRAVEYWNVQLPWQIDDFIEGVTTFSDFSSAEIVAAVANHYPDSIMAPYTSAWDHNQIAFYYTMLHTTYWDMIFNWSNYYTNVDAFAEEWNAKMYHIIVDTLANTTEGNFRYYISPGYHHTILGSPEFYTEISNGYDLVGWITQMLESGLEGLPNVACSGRDEECVAKPVYPDD